MIPALPRIQVLKLIALALDPKQSDDIESAQEDRVDVSDNRRHHKDGFAGQPSLKELHINSCSSSRHLSHTVADTMATLRLFHSVGRFVWELAFWVPPRTTTEIPEQSSSSVRVDAMELMLNHLWWKSAASALPSVILPHNLSTLSVHSAIFWKEVCATGTLLRTVGRNLTNFTLNFYSPIGYRRIPPPSELSVCRYTAQRRLYLRSCASVHCCRDSPLPLPGSLAEIAARISADGLSRLETLGCTLSVEDPTDVGCQWLSVLAALISTAGPSLRTVQITIQVDNGAPGVDADVDWAQLDQSMGAHAGLETVEVVFRCHPDDPPNTTGPDPEEVVKSGLRAASARGIVHVAVEVSVPLTGHSHDDARC